MRDRTLSYISCLTPLGIPGGGERDRTDDLMLAKHALSQLSYTPDMKLVGLVGFEPTTPRLSSVCSNQLSYRPGFKNCESARSGFRFKHETRNSKLETFFANNR